MQIFTRGIREVPPLSYLNQVYCDLGHINAMITGQMAVGLDAVMWIIYGSTNPTRNLSSVWLGRHPIGFLRTVSSYVAPNLHNTHFLNSPPDFFYLIYEPAEYRVQHLFAKTTDGSRCMLFCADQIDMASSFLLYSNNVYLQCIATPSCDPVS